MKLFSNEIRIGEMGTFLERKIHEALTIIECAVISQDLTIEIVDVTATPQGRPNHMPGGVRSQIFSINGHYRIVSCGVPSGKVTFDMKGVSVFVYGDGRILMHHNLVKRLDARSYQFDVYWDKSGLCWVQHVHADGTAADMLKSNHDLLRPDQLGFDPPVIAILYSMGLRHLAVLRRIPEQRLREDAGDSVVDAVQTCLGRYGYKMAK